VNVGVLHLAERLRLENMGKQPVLSRHRLPGVYRYSILVLWLTPIFLLIFTVILGKGVTPAVLDVRLIIPLAVLALPALYIWQEGVDVLPNGIRARVQVPRYYTYTALGTYYYDARTDRHVLTIWDAESRKVLECRARHLTHFPTLLASLKANVRWRSFPS
jgi:hypothetical protein